MRRMHRGSSRGGGQNWQQQRLNNASMHAPGPLMTDHLGLQDIDKELELLKRKREIIEQQQQILSHEFMRNEPQFNQSSRFDDYSKLYDDMRTYDHPSRKRPIAVWEDEIPTKRFSGPSRAPRARPQRPTSVFNAGFQSAQPRQPYRPPNKTPQTKTSQKTSNNSKVTKNTPPMNKMDTYPVAERKKLVSEANGEADSKAKLFKLRSDRDPTPQMTGRLELALGSIIKDIKSNPTHTDAVKSMSVMRQIKKTVRDRIREVMMGQIVGPGDAIKARYRQVYDVQSDNEIVEKALQNASTDVPRIVTPEEYFKTNMNKIVESRLKDMMKKLEEITRLNNQTSSKQHTAAAATAAATDSDAVAAESKPDTVAADSKPDAVAEASKPDAVAEASKPDAVATDSKPEPGAAASKPDAVATDSKPDVTPKDEDLERIKKSQTFLDLEKIMMHRILLSIKKQIPHIIHVQNMDAKFNQLKNNIANETIKKLTRKPGDVTQDFTEDIEDATVQVQSTPKPPRAPYKPLPYFAKLMGKPGLPKRNLMQVFFEDYQPKSIKKHRSVHNLLFVGFEDKEAYDKLLAADGTKIGKFTLSIRVSERNQDTKQKGKEDQNSEENGELNTSSSSDKIIGSELDEQISDLLTCIKNENEEAGENPGDTDEGNVQNEESTVEEPENTDTDNQGTDADVQNPEADIENTDEAVDNIEETNTQDTNGEQPPKEEAEVADAVPEINDPKPKGTPVRTSARIAGTPSRVQTRRASRLVPNDA